MRMHARAFLMQILQLHCFRISEVVFQQYSCTETPEQQCEGWRFNKKKPGIIKNKVTLSNFGWVFCLHIKKICIIRFFMFYIECAKICSS